MGRCLGVVILVSVLAAGSASAFTWDSYWAYSPVPYEITSWGSDDVWDGSDLDAVRAAFATWQEVLFNRLSFYEAGLVSWLPYPGDSYNTVGWIETLLEDWRTDWTFSRDPSALAISWCWYDIFTKVTSECDIVVNGIHHSWSPTGAPDTEDIQGVLTHEVGHFVGLGHSEDPSALMYPVFSLRTPQEDDIVGARYIYFGEDIDDFVTRLYHVVLGREPDGPGLWHNVRLTLHFGEVETVVGGFFFSPEFLGGAGADPTAFVTALYRTALNREPDPAGLMHNVNLITGGAMTRHELLDGFLATPEFQVKDPFRSW